MDKSYITTPNLPQNRVKECLIGECYSEEISELSALGVNCIKIPYCDSLEAEISCHADIQVFNMGNGNLIISRQAGEALTELLRDYNLCFENTIKSPYPNDVKLNAAFLGNKIVCNKNYISDYIINFALSNNIEILHTKQGYSRCSICIADKNAVITEDSALASLLKKYQFDVLLIKQGEIYLSDSHYGFIGGASAKISQNEMYFSGDISAHSDFYNIKGFLNNYGISMIYDHNRKLTDFGGIIQLTE